MSHLVAVGPNWFPFSLSLQLINRVRLIMSDSKCYGKRTVPPSRALDNSPRTFSLPCSAIGLELGVGLVKLGLG